MSYERTVEVITPQKAKIYLQENIVNRRLSQPRVSAYADDMLNSNWKLTDDAIRFDVDGNLVDGQHRLCAIVRSGCSVKMHVTRNIPKDEAIFDRNRPRSVSDRLLIEGFDKKIANKETVAIAKLFYSMKVSNKGMSDFQVKKFIENHKDSICALNEIHCFSQKRGNLNTRNACVELACLFAYESGEDINKISRFCDILSTGFYNGEKERAAIVIRNDLINKSIDASRNGVSRISAVIAIEKAIYDFCRDYPRMKSYKNEATPTYSNNSKFSIT